LQFFITDASAEPNSSAGIDAVEEQVAEQLAEVLQVLNGRNLSGMSTADITSTASDLIDIVNLFRKNESEADAVDVGVKSDVGELIAMVAAQFADVLPANTTVWKTSDNVALVLTNINVRQQYELNFATIAAVPSGEVVGIGSAVDESKFAGIAMTLPPYSKFDPAKQANRQNNTNKNATNANDVSSDHVGVVSAVFSDSVALFDGYNVTSHVLSVKFGVDSKVGTPFGDGELVRFSLPVITDFASLVSAIV
jgi:hypothetical protein